MYTWNSSPWSTAKFQKHGHERPSTTGGTVRHQDFSETTGLILLGPQGQGQPGAQDTGEDGMKDPESAYVHEYIMLYNYIYIYHMIVCCCIIFMAKRRVPFPIVTHDLFGRSKGLWFRWVWNKQIFWENPAFPVKCIRSLRGLKAPIKGLCPYQWFPLLPVTIGHLSLGCQVHEGKGINQGFSDQVGQDFFPRIVWIQ